MNLFNALVKKELREAFRDRRGLMAAFLFALMAPVMIYALSQLAIKEAAEKPPVYVKIIGGEQAPRLVQSLTAANILSIDELAEDDRALWQKRDISLVIPEDFGASIREGKTVEVVLRADFSDQNTDGYLRRIKREVAVYSQQIGVKRLMMRGIDGRLLQPVALVEKDTSVPSSNTGFITMLLVMYLMMAAFFSSMSVAIDSSAGERERNVLEVLLCQPVSTLMVVLAKLTAASIIAMLGVVLTLLLSVVAIDLVDLAKIGLSFELDAVTVITLLLVLLPICLFSAALQLFVAFQAKSFKEAQSTVTMIIMVPAMLPMAMTFIKDKPLWLDWMPITGQNQLMENLFKGMDVSYAAMAGTAGVTLLATVAMVQVLAARLKSEKVVLGLS